MWLFLVAQKLNQFRVPVGKTVKLTFERKVSKISLNPENRDDSPVEEKVVYFYIVQYLVFFKPLCRPKRRQMM